MDTTSNKEPVEAENQRLLLNELVGELPNREAKALKLRYGLSGEQPHNLSAVAATLGCSSCEVDELLTSGLDTLGTRLIEHGEAYQEDDEHSNDDSE